MGGETYKIHDLAYFFVPALFLIHSLLLPFNTLNPVPARKIFLCALVFAVVNLSFGFSSVVSCGVLHSCHPDQSCHPFQLRLSPSVLSHLWCSACFFRGLSLLSLSLPLFRRCFRPLVGIPSTQTSPSSRVYVLIRILILVVSMRGVLEYSLPRPLVLSRIY